LSEETERHSGGEPDRRSAENPLARLVSRVPVRIRTKLLVAFAAMVLLLVGVGVLGQRVLSESNDRLETLARLQKNLTVYRLLKNDNIALQQIVGSRVGGDIEAFVGQSSTPNGESVPSEWRYARAPGEPILRRLRNYYDFRRLDFDPTAEEQRVLQQIETDFERFVSAMTKSVELDGTGKVAEAQSLVITEVKPLLTRLGSATDQLANRAEAAVGAVARENRAAFVNSQRISVLYAAGAIGLAVLFGFAISSSFIGPVQRMDIRLGEIALGDFSGRVEVSNRDELGTLATNLNRMNDELGRLYSVVQTQAASLSELNGTLEARVEEQATEILASRARIVATADAERRRIERNIHDGAQQQLVALAVNLNLARRSLADDPATAASMLDQLVKDARAAVEELRNLAHGIYPPLLLDSGLPSALSAAATRSPLSVSVAIDGVGRYAPDLEAAVYFCCLEALQNATKHAADASVSVRLWQEADRLHFEVADDGPGFDPAVVKGGQGLLNMSDRTAAAGGEAAWDSSPGRGTRVSGWVPLSA
jgi:signal transduction histidine kinase